MTGEIFDAVPWSHAVQRVKVGDWKGVPLTLLRMQNMEWRFAHLCERAARNAGTILCAPLLDLHTVTVEGADRDQITVTPSILCPDCGIHGYITLSVWRSA